MRQLLLTLTFFASLSYSYCFGQCPADAGADRTICSGSSTILGPPLANVDPGLNYSWSPATSLNNANVARPICNTTTSRTYTLTVTPRNLIANANFEGGNTGFGTDYNLGGGGYGNYSITSSPSNMQAGWCNMPDHSTPGTNMLIADGYSVNADDFRIWHVTVDVTPNTNYRFTGFVSSVSNITVPMDIRAIVNRNLPGSASADVNTNSAACSTWTQFTVNWNSGSNTQAVLELHFISDTPIGNDVAIDDLFFGMDCAQGTDQVSVSVTSGTPAITPVGPIEYYYWYEGTIQIPLNSNKSGQWYKNNVAIPGAVGFSYTATYQGNGTPTDNYKCVSQCGTSNIVTITAVGCTTNAQYPVTIPPAPVCPNDAVTGWMVSQVNKTLSGTYEWQLTYGDYWQLANPNSRFTLLNLSDPNAPPPATEYVYARAVAPGGSETRMSFGVGLYVVGCRKAPPKSDGPGKATLFPNPANAEVTISSKKMLQRVEIYNSMGVMIKSIPVVKSSILNVKTGDMVPGLYTVKVISADNMEVLKLVITR